MSQHDALGEGRRFDEHGIEILEACPKCGTTSPNCPLTRRQRCPYDIEPNRLLAEDYLRTEENT